MSTHSRILDTLKARSSWDERQRVFYEARHNGIRRKNKPWEGAADLHFPLIDSVIDKLKPFYFSQLYATETFASFVSRKDQSAALTTAAAQSFDYELRQRSNLEREILTTIDGMLMSGAAFLKVYRDEDEQRLAFDCPAPGMVIVPLDCTDLQKADWLVQVHHVSEAAYRANTLYRQDDEFIAAIKGDGSGSKDDGVNTSLEQEKARREGITTSASDKDRIILWERYRRTAEGKWLVRWYSPLRPKKEDSVREEMEVPYAHGKLPFVLFQTEVKDKGVYASRGIAELLLTHETYLNKTWNTKADYQTFTTRPLFTSEKEIPNAQNIRMVPGQVLPFAIQAVTFPRPPMDLDQEMQFVRNLAEYRIGTPDFGTGVSRVGEGKGKVTATEVEQIGNLMSQSNDIRARLFRLSTAEVFRMGWQLFCEFCGDSYQYLVDNAAKAVTRDALHDGYEITPNGSSDSWDKGNQMKRAVVRYQMFRGHPNIQQGALAKSILVQDDPRLVKDLFIDDGVGSYLQAERQAMEIPVLLEGFPLKVKPDDDDLVHLQTLLHYVEKAQMTGTPVDVVARENLHNHLDAHVAAAAQKDPKLGRQAQALVQQAVQQGMAQSAAPQAATAPSNVVPMPSQQGGAPAPASGAPAGDNGAQDKAKVLTALASVMNAQAALLKAGVPVTRDEISAVMQMAGLPPLPSAPAPVQPQPQEVAA